MAKTSKSMLIKAPMKKVFNTIIDFKSYPKIFPEVLKSKIIKKGKKAADVNFVFDLITSINCNLKFTLEPEKVSWKLIKGDFMKANTGHWLLEEKKNGTKATYTIDVEPSMFVPRSVLDQLIKRSAPNMIKSLKKWCEQKNKS